MKRMALLLVGIAMLLPFCTGLAEDTAADTSGGRENSYLRYREQHAQAQWGDQAVTVAGDDAAVEEGGSVTLGFTIPQTGLYEIHLRHFIPEGKGARPEYELEIDGEAPFFEASYLSLFRVFEDAEEPGTRRDSNDNDLSVAQVEVPAWQQVPVEDYSGVYSNPYAFFLTEGEHEITIRSTRDTFLVGEITLRAPETLLSYEEQLALWEAQGLAAVDADLIKIEAEKPLYKNDSVLFAKNDRASADTTPYSTSKIRLNIIGTDSWKQAGQWIEWKVEAPEDGLYVLGFRARQNKLSGAFSTRTLSVNGEIPFEEARTIEFSYDMGWERVVFPYRIALKTGENVIRLTATPGRLSPLIASVEQTLSTLNTAYRNVSMITGPVPDRYRDYMLNSMTPESFEMFAQEAENLQAASDTLVALTGSRGSMNGVLQSFANLLKGFVESPEKVQNQVNVFKDNNIALGTWLLDIKASPLELDCLYIVGDEAQIPEANSGLGKQIAHEAGAFAASFSEDYELIGDASQTDRQITVWVQTGRDQATIIKDMINNGFTPETGISVDLKLVQRQLLAATVSGNGPDVALQVSSGEPVNYALRKASMPLSGFEGFEEVMARFRESAMVPYAFAGDYYGLPETQTFPMMFYRTDVFEEMGLSVPETWDDMFRVIGRLQKNKMNVGILPPTSVVGAASGLSSMAMLLYQHGGEFYLDNNQRSGLGEDEAVAAFRMWLSLYVDYSLPVKYDAQTRFRTGEMPLVIDDYTLYNTLSVTAPEIRGLWSFAPVPGTVQADGSVDHTVGGAGTACMMLKNAKDPEAAWAFMEWWTRAETQLAFGLTIENQLGPSARYATANIEAFTSLPWPVADLEKINAQWDNVRGIPEVAGGYFTSRHINNAFRKVLEGDDPKETLLDYVDIINREITHKRQEIGLPVEEGIE